MWFGRVEKYGQLKPILPFVIGALGSWLPSDDNHEQQFQQLHCQCPAFVFVRCPVVTKK